MDALDSWKEEMRSAYLYRVVAECEAGTVREGLFKQLAIEAESQAQIWVDQIRKEGVVRIASLRTLKEEEKEKLELLKQKRAAEAELDFETAYLVVNYANL